MVANKNVDKVAYMVTIELPSFVTIDHKYTGGAFLKLEWPPYCVHCPGLDIIRSCKWSDCFAGNIAITKARLAISVTYQQYGSITTTVALCRYIPHPELHSLWAIVFHQSFVRSLVEQNINWILIVRRFFGSSCKTVCSGSFCREETKEVKS